MKDKLGFEIKKGDIIAYAVRHANSGQMNIGTILETKMESVKVLGINYFAKTGDVSTFRKPGTLFNSDRIVILKKENLPENIQKHFGGNNEN